MDMIRYNMALVACLIFPLLVFTIMQKCKVSQQYQTLFMFTFWVIAVPLLYSLNSSLIFEAWSLNDDIPNEALQRPTESFFLKAVFYAVTFLNFLTWLFLSMAVAVWPCALCVGFVLIKDNPW